MKSYTPASEDVQERALVIIRRFHPDLEKVQVRIDFIFVSNDSEDAPALTLGGYPCQAVVKIIGPKERAMERGDAEIVIDEENWMELNDAEKDALLDHELYHLQVVKNKTGTREKRDCVGRPVLKMRKHDRQFGWFDAVARRHGAASAEVIQFKQFVATNEQLYLGLTFIQDQIAKMPGGFAEGGFVTERVEKPDLKALRPDGVDSVSITMPGKGVGVKIDAAGVHKTDGAGNVIAPEATSTTAKEGGNDGQLNSNEPAAISELPPAQPDAVKAALIGDISEGDVIAAWQTITELDRASVATLQRRHRIGYNRAAALIDELEKRGVVGPAKDGTHDRDILKPYAQPAAA